MRIAEVRFARSSTSDAPAKCPVCRSAATAQFILAGACDYWRCGSCEARFLDPRHFLSREAEHAHYLCHENDTDDPRYRRFLSQLADPLLARLLPGSRGLDYGCGPGPALAAMLREAGHETALWDPFFCPDPAPLNRTYDFVTCTETAEHFHRPAEEFDRLVALLRPGGLLAVMTRFPPEDAQFADWRYRKDPTHAVFYSEATLRYLAESRGCTCEIPAKNVALIQKPAEGPRNT